MLLDLAWRLQLHIIYNLVHSSWVGMRREWLCLQWKVLVSKILALSNSGVNLDFCGLWLHLREVFRLERLKWMGHQLLICSSWWWGDMVTVCTEKHVLSIRFQRLTFTKMSWFSFSYVMAYIIVFNMFASFISSSGLACCFPWSFLKYPGKKPFLHKSTHLWVYRPQRWAYYDAVDNFRDFFLIISSLEFIAWSGKLRAGVEKRVGKGRWDRVAVMWVVDPLKV